MHSYLIHAKTYPLFSYSHRCTQLTHFCAHVHVQELLMCEYSCLSCLYSQRFLFPLFPHMYSPSHPQPFPLGDQNRMAGGVGSLQSRIPAAPAQTPAGHLQRLRWLLGRGSCFTSSMRWAQGPQRWKDLALITTGAPWDSTDVPIVDICRGVLERD